MASPYTRLTISAGFGAETAINAETAKLVTAFESCLNKDDSTDNAMNVDLDMNGYRILNASGFTPEELIVLDSYTEAQLTSTHLATANESEVVRQTDGANAGIVWSDGTSWNPLSSGDADSIEGIAVSQLVRADTDDTMTGAYTVTGSMTVDSIVVDGTRIDTADAATPSALTVATGASSSGGNDGGDLTLTTGTGSIDGGSSGDITVSTAAGGSSPDDQAPGFAGNVSIQAGAGGSCTGTTTSTDGESGGDVTINSGTGGSTSGQNGDTAGDGGDITVAALSGGNATDVSGGTGGNGGSVAISGGSGGVSVGDTGGDGGNITISGGIGMGGGVGGNITLFSTNQIQIAVGSNVVQLSTSGILINGASTVVTPSFTNPPVFPEYTVASLPSASTYDNGVIIVSDETGGRTLATSDGTNWRRVSDGAVVS